MDTAEALILLLILLAGFGLAAKRLRVPEPIIFVLGGLVVSLIPGLPRVELKPEYVFLLAMPPLLYAQAWMTSWREFCAQLRSISLLAIGLVVFTTLAVGYTLHALAPELPLAAGFALGAIVSPPDAVAAAAIAERLRLPKQMVIILEGESLVNDATGLVAFKFALAALATGAFSAPKAVGEFVWVAGGGAALGMGVGWVFTRILARTKDDFIVIVLSLIPPYSAYLLAERLGLSGVLATVASGLWLGSRSSGLLSSSARLTGAAFWNIMVFLLNGVLFMLIGLQLPGVMRELKGVSAGTLAYQAAVICGVVVATRIIWVFPGAYLPRRLIPAVGRRDPMPPWRNLAVFAWCGMRGVVSLAAAMALPHALPSGAPFPGRGLLVFLSFSVVLFTLVAQGLTLPWLIRRMRVKTGKDHRHLEREARLAAAQAAWARLREVAEANNFEAGSLAAVAGVYQERINQLSDELAESLGWSPLRKRFIESRRLRREAVEAERSTLIRLYRENHLSKEILHLLERELDLEEARMR
jgi:CPA1 family monovalent cation:H+ antiporter